MSNLQELPTGFADFPTIRQEGYFYADKTRLLRQLIKIPKPYFLSRPRRFGKSLLVSTLEAILAGRRELFEGLWINDHSDYDWTPNPVIYLSMYSVTTDSIVTVQSDLLTKLKDIAKREKLKPNGETPAAFFESLLGDLHDKYGRKVAVLIDEYDTPILSKLTETDLAIKIRETLGKFYGVLKSAEKYRGFTFITGVTKFTKASVFSALNNLEDLTLDENYASICGFILEEFETLFEMFGPKILARFQANGSLPQEASLDDLRARILEWYDGYSWDGETRILNPWSTLHFFSKMKFSDYWLTSGPPSFMDSLVRESQINFSSMKNVPYLTDSMNAVDIGQFETKALLFQAGYLTVKQVNNKIEPEEFYLGYPNLEVEAAVARNFFNLNEPFGGTLLKRSQAKAALKFLLAGDTSQFQAAFESILGDINYHLHLPYEAFYQTVFQLVLDLAGQIYDSEGSVSGGRYDLHFRASNGDDYVIELKHVSIPEDDGASDKDSSPAEAGKPKARPKGKNPLQTLKALKAKMNKAARIAAAQIDLNRYVQKFQGGGNAIYKAALVIGGRSNVLLVLKEAKNWTPEKQFDNDLCQDGF
ncbi:MAG: AAA family ATPase [Deltaproteobacteria bacterium]|jgi:hypothetical protein|nr:AAA family ATPase [Deltaproteobacteria bacterium]